METKLERKDDIYKTNTANLINGKVFYMGLSPSQFVIVFVISIILGILLRLFSIPVIIGIFAVFAKISKENRKGHPDYLSSLIIKHLPGYKNHFEDSDFIFSKLKKK